MVTRAEARAEAEARAAADAADARARLRELLDPVDTIFCVLRWVNRVGDNRAISLLIPAVERAEPGARYARGEALTIVDLSYLMARAGMGTLRPGSGGIVTRGGGMDMGFDLVYNLCRDLGPYLCQVDRCRSNAHMGPDAKPRHYTLEHDDGYRFDHRWI